MELKTIKRSVLLIILVLAGLLLFVSNTEAAVCDEYLSETRYAKYEKEHDRTVRDLERDIAATELAIVNAAGTRESLIYSYHGTGQPAKFKPGYITLDKIWRNYEESVADLQDELEDLNRALQREESSFERVCLKPVKEVVEVENEPTEEVYEYNGEEYTLEEYRVVLITLLLELLKQLHEKSNV